MRKVPRSLVVLVVAPFLANCMATMSLPLPEPAERSDADIRGLVLGSTESEERIEYKETQFVEWTDSTVAITGILSGEGQNVTTQTYQIQDVAAILVHQLHPDRTSVIVAGLLVGAGVLGALLFTGETNEETVFETPR